MASKSFGQIAGTVIGAAVGFFAGGNVALGASIGGMIGGMIDPPKGPTVVGPRLDDLSFQTSTLGAPLGRAYGTVPILGNVVWLEGDRYLEVITSEEQGGKGGPTATTETAHYYATFAVSLLRVTDPTKTMALRRLWIGSNLVYDAGSDNIESVIASNSQSALFTFYGGSDDQQPNTRWQADKGANAVSGFPGRCYIVIYDLDLEPYSRSLAMAQVKVELVSGAPVQDSDFIRTLSDTTTKRMATAVVTSDACDYMLISHDGLDNIIGAESWRYRYGEPDIKVSDIAISMSSGTGYTAPQMMACHQCANNDIRAFAIIGAYLYGPLRSQLVMISDSGYVVGAQVDDGDWNYGDALIFASDGSEAFAASASTSAKVLQFINGILVATSSMSVRASSIGYSESYVFVADYVNSNATTCVIHKFDRSLVFIETLTLSANGANAVLQVVGDAELFIKSGAVASHYSAGIVTTIGSVLRSSVTPMYSWFWCRSSDQHYGISVTQDLTTLPHDVYISHVNVMASVASLHDVVTSECGLAGVSAGDIDLTALTDSDVRGYRISNAGSIRSSLEMLQAAFPFDVAPSGYKLRFVSRGGASLATIPEADLGATDSPSSLPVLLPSAREMDTQIPYKVSVRYLDPAREYDIGEQYASRPDTASVSERTVELSLVMTGDEAAKAADVLNQKDWLERVSFGTFSLPPTWRDIEPPDVVTVEHRGQAHTIRLTRAEFLPDGRIECAGVYSSAQCYTSSATAQESLTVGQSLVPLKGSTQQYLLDIPRILSNQDVPGMTFGMVGLASGWPGGALLRSDDSGSTWQTIGGMNVGAKVFVSGAALASNAGYSADCSAALDVTPLNSLHTLSSVSESQLHGYANLAAYGSDGRWEIIAFKTVTDNTGSYTLRDFLRGLYGTEWATGLHVAGDLMLMLDATTVGFFGLPVNAIGSQRIYRSVTQGASIDSAPNAYDTYDAVNLTPLSPVDVRADRSLASKDWTVSASRRTRWPVALFSGMAQPLGETSEQYEVEFWTAGYGALIRTISSLSSPTCVYSSANQIADFGSNQNTITGYFRQVSSVVGRGYSRPFSFTQMLDDDPYFSAVVLGLHMEGTNGSTTFTDIKGNTITAVGNAQLTTGAPQFSFGASCGLFDGTGDYLSFPASSILNFGADLFTVDGFVRPGAIGSIQGLVEGRGSTAAVACSFFIDIKPDGKLEALASSTNAGSSGSWAVILTSSAALVSGTAYHFEISRGAGNVWRMFIDGIQVSTTTVNVTVGSPATTGYIATGVSSAGVLGYTLTGRMKDVRITKGVCRHTSNFTPPTSPFPDS